VPEVGQKRPEKQDITIFFLYFETEKPQQMTWQRQKVELIWKEKPGGKACNREILI
jgi:hypothetical protein